MIRFYKDITLVQHNHLTYGAPTFNHIYSYSAPHNDPRVNSRHQPFYIDVNFQLANFVTSAGCNKTRSGKSNATQTYIIAQLL